MIGTLESPHECRLGDWIIQGIKGELYPCRDDIFKATYDPAAVESDLALATREALSPSLKEQERT